MVTSLLINGTYKVRVNSAGDIKVGERKFNVHKDIPVLRYKLPVYDDNAIEYIKKMQEKFPESLHIVQVEASQLSVELWNNTLDEMGVAKYLYIDITDDVVNNGTFGQEMLAGLAVYSGTQIDRVMLRDRLETQLLNTLSARPLRQEVCKALSLKENMVGFCDSPLSLGDTACLQAEKARELMAKYCEVTSMSLPTSNHQCMNNCGCMRYIEITEDTQLIESSGGIVSNKDKQVKKKSKKSNKGTNPQAYLF